MGGGWKRGIITGKRAGIGVDRHGFSWMWLERLGEGEEMEMEGGLGGLLLGDEVIRKAIDFMRELENWGLVMKNKSTIWESCGTEDWW